MLLSDEADRRNREAFNRMADELAKEADMFNEEIEKKVEELGCSRIEQFLFMEDTLAKVEAELRTTIDEIMLEEKSRLAESKKKEEKSQPPLSLDAEKKKEEKSQPPLSLDAEKKIEEKSQPPLSLDAEKKIEEKSQPPLALDAEKKKEEKSQPPLLLDFEHDELEQKWCRCVFLLERKLKFAKILRLNVVKEISHATVIVRNEKDLAAMKRVKDLSWQGTYCFASSVHPDREEDLRDIAEGLGLHEYVD